MNNPIFEITLTPEGSLVVVQSESDEAGGERAEAWLKRVMQAFSSSNAAGIFMLAASKQSSHIHPSFSYWRDFGRDYLTRRCRTPEYENNNLQSIEPLTDAEVSSMLLSAPPMRGGEYLNDDIIHGLWREIDVWALDEIASLGKGLSGWLKEHAPLWLLWPNIPHQS